MGEEKLIVAGFGGQGVMALGQILTYAGMVEKKEVAWVPSYGPEMRGGTANCNVIISSAEIGAPVVNIADSVIVFNEASFDKFEAKVRPGGVLIVNSSMTKKKSQREDINIHYIDANRLAQEIGNEKTLNMVMLGAYLGERKIVSMDSIEKGFLQVFGEKRANLWEINKKAIEKGISSVS